ncbi:MAG TPA: hypothetical protein VKQ89_04835 [Candidatus Angelobacter sp.]|nr:hypothetical protein [Candidatus Angelobacter sp.]
MRDTSEVSLARRGPQAAGIPWLVWANVIASLCISAGLYWDISWHETIGRDTFWTPAHLVVQFGAILAAFGSAWVILRTTFSGDAEARANSVNVLGFRAPLGAFISAWGGVAMVTSAPFDNWWHEAYGLDVKIISPPHVLLAVGIAGIMWGGAILAASNLNRAEGPRRETLRRIVLVIGGFIVIQTMTLKLEYTNRILLHSALSYMVLSIGTLLILEALARVSGHRWARTIMTGVYSAFVLILMWVLPLFPAQPKLGPVYQNITHMVPLPFPILLIIPAFFLDLMWPIFKDAPKPQQALFGGVAFTAILIAVQWPFTTFLMSPAARNRLFATVDFPYFALPSWPGPQHIFVHAENSPGEFWMRMGLAFLFAVLSMWIGIYWGNWLKKVRR